MQMIIANRLTDGRVVFMDTRGVWVDSIQDGALLLNGSDSERLMALAQRSVGESRIVDPYLIEMTVDGAERRPAHIRECIRVRGPSVRTDLLVEAA